MKFNAIKNSNSIYLLTFLGVLLLSITLLYVINENSRQLYKATEDARLEQRQKVSIMFRFMYILSGRTKGLLDMYNEQDVFERYELELQMAEDASEFVKIRDQLAAMRLSRSERVALDEVLVAIRAYMPVEREVINLLIEDELTIVRDTLLERVLPLQSAIYLGDSHLFYAIIGSGKEVEQQLQQRRSTIQMQIYLLSFCVVITSLIFIAILVHRMRLVSVVDERTRELRDTISRLKVLEGFISICSYCKNIRSNTGDWNILEDYIQKHSNAKFTHGICPDCADKEREKLKTRMRSG